MYQSYEYLAYCSEYNSQYVIEKRDDKDWVYLYPFYKAEKNISDRLNLLNECKNVKIVDYSVFLK